MEAFFILAVGFVTMKFEEYLFAGPGGHRPRYPDAWEAWTSIFLMVFAVCCVPVSIVVFALSL